MMVAIREWMSLWLCVKLPKTSESLIDRTTVAKNVQTGKLGCSSMDHHLAALPVEPVRTSDEELKEGDISALTWPHATPDPPRKILITNNEEVMVNRNHNENPATKGRPLSEERKAHIKHQMAINQKKFEEMRARGEPMVKWINIITKMEQMMTGFSFGIQGETTASMLRKLKGVQLDIRRVVRARFRDWIGLGGRVFEPLQEEEVSNIPEMWTRELTESFESTLRGTNELSSNPNVVDVIESHPNVNLQPKTSSSIVLKSSNEKQAFKGRLEKVQNLIKEEAIESSVKCDGKTLGDQENPTSQLTESSIMIIDDGIMESSFNYLVHILQSVTFASWEYNPAIWIVYQKEIRVTKFTFQRSLLQIIQFMCKFELVKKGKLESFLESNNTLDLIRNHVIDFSYVVQQHVDKGDALLLDMEDLRNYYEAYYLHDLFEVISVMGISQDDFKTIWKSSF